MAGKPSSSPPDPHHSNPFVGSGGFWSGQKWSPEKSMSQQGQLEGQPQVSPSQLAAAQQASTLLPRNTPLSTTSDGHQAGGPLLPSSHGKSPAQGFTASGPPSKTPSVSPPASSSPPTPNSTAPLSLASPAPKRPTSVLPPLNLDAVPPSTTSLCPGTIFSSRRALVDAVTKKCHFEGGFKAIVLRSAVRYDHDLADHPGFNGYFYLCCSENKIPSNKANRCHFEIKVLIHYVEGEEEQWKIHKIVNKHNHPAPSAGELGAWKAPSYSSEVPRLMEKKKRKVKETLEGDSDGQSDEGDERDELKSEGEDGHSDSSIVVSNRGGGRLGSPASSNATSPSTRKRRPCTSSTSARPSTRLRLSVPYPFPTTLRSFTTREEWETAKTRVALDMGVTLWSRVTGRSIRYDCSVGRSRKAGDSHLGCQWMMRVQEDSDGMWRVVEKESNWEHNHELTLGRNGREDEVMEEAKGFAGDEDSDDDILPVASTSAQLLQHFPPPPSARKLPPPQYAASEQSLFSLPGHASSVQPRLSGGLAAYSAGLGQQGQPVANSSAASVDARPQRASDVAPAAEKSRASARAAPVEKGQEQSRATQPAAGKAKEKISKKEPQAALEEIVISDSSDDEVDIKPSVAASISKPAAPPRTAVVKRENSVSTTPAPPPSSTARATPAAVQLPSTDLPDFLDSLDPRHNLSRFTDLFRRLGFDTVESLVSLSVADVDGLVELVVKQAKAEANGQNAISVDGKDTLHLQAFGRCLKGRLRE